MNPGPLRRLSGSLGLVALVPTAWLLSVGAITLTEAAWRAAATLVVVVALGRLVGWVLGGLAGSFERESEEAVERGDREDGGSGTADGAGTPAASTADGAGPAAARDPGGGGAAEREPSAATSTPAAGER